MIKPGWKTSEAWLLLLVIILTNIQASGLIETTHWTMKTATVAINVLGVLGYTAHRARLKIAGVVAGTTGETSQLNTGGASLPELPAR